MSATAKTVSAAASPAPGYDPVALAESLAAAAEKSAKLMGDFATRHAGGGGSMLSDELGIGKAFMELAAKMLANPYRMAESQMNLWWRYMNLWQSSTMRMLGAPADPVAEPAKGDKRFKHEDWEQHFLFDYVKQGYLITAHWLHDAVANVEGLDDGTRKKVDFFTRQYIDALAPSNFALTNPEVFRETITSGGQNLVRGLHNLLDDIERGGGQLKISMTDTKAFELGVNIATTPGKVVYQNELMQLIQYEPSTAKVHKRPLLIMPPWINKYYILDLREKNSMVKWAVDQGITTFVMSWVNPDAELAHKDFEDYLVEGPLAALDAIEKATGETEVNALGYCLGGTLLAAALAYMAAKKDKRIVSATFMAALVDFVRTGELEVFIDEVQVASLEKKMNERGYPRRQRDGEYVQHAALQRPDLVVRHQQLPARTRPVPIRSPALERRFDADAGDDAQLLPAQHVHEEPAEEARRDQARRRSDRPREDHGADVFRVRDRGPHRAVEGDLFRPEADARQVAVRVVGIGAHRRHDQSAVGEQVLLLDRRETARRAGRLVRKREAASGLVVERLERVAQAVPRQGGSRARARQGQAQGHRGIAGKLRARARRSGVKCVDAFAIVSGSIVHGGSP